MGRPQFDIYLSREIKALPKYNLLTAEEKITLLRDGYNLGNLQSMPQYLNASKGANTNWTLYGTTQLNKTYADNLFVLQKELAEIFKAKIAELTKGRK